MKTYNIPYTHIETYVNQMTIMDVSPTGNIQGTPSGGLNGVVMDAPSYRRLI